MAKFDPYALHDYFVTCARGSERVLSHELTDLGVRSVAPRTAGISCKMKIADAYRVCMWSRTASRVLYSLRDIPGKDANELYRWAKGIHWEEHITGPESTIAVDVTGTTSKLRDTQFTAVRVKDAVCDRLRELWDDQRPSVNAVDPDVRINVLLKDGKAKVSIDFAGTSLHRRGYRTVSHKIEAPMKENLAATMLLMAGWRELAKEGGAFVDPMCGSGTLAIEAAMIAGDRAPGLMRSKWGFEGWKNHDEEAWAKIVEDADARAEAGLSKIPRIVGSDIDPDVVAVAKENVKHAGLGGHIEITQGDVSNILNPTPESSAIGLVACNPPYGERMETQAQLPALYSMLGSRLAGEFGGWKVAIITPDEGLSEGLDMLPEATYTLYNGRIKSPLHLYTVGEESGTTIEVSLGNGKTQELHVSDGRALEFANRLKKMAAHWGKWARKQGISCYRVYDADLPAYNVVIDVYATDTGRIVHVAEYSPPHDVDVDLAQARLKDVLAITPLVLNVDRKNVYSKRRWRARGGAQYAKDTREHGITEIMSEGGLDFEVNFSDYLDTGIFLDQRLTREMIRQEAKGTRFLNLFAYTGTASVYAADGGAFSTTTVDLSNTYLEWAQRNFNLNGFAAAFGKLLEDQTVTHELMRADVVDWIGRERRTKHRYDLIFCDPPTFSNSAKMKGNWDVQRDHAELIIGFSRLLTRDGHAYFSCNKKGFKLDEELLLRYNVLAKDVTASTISPDFERSGGGHKIWRITYKRRV